MSEIDEYSGMGTCANCGRVKMSIRNLTRKDGTPYVRYLCSIGRREQRGEKNPNIVRDDSNDKSTSGHGLTRGEARLFKQGKSCQICGSMDRLVVDHCHISGVIRGVLCHQHNAALGLFKDNAEHLELAALYLKSFA